MNAKADTHGSETRVLPELRKNFAEQPWRYWNYSVTIALMKCNDCGTEVLAFESPDGSGQRISEHKCSGAWTTVKKFPVNFDQETLEIYALERLKR